MSIVRDNSKFGIVHSQVTVGSSVVLVENNKFQLHFRWLQEFKSLVIN